MIDERIERILQDEIDGTASPEERREIEALVARDPEVRAYREGLHRLARGIEDLPVVPAPAELKPRILSTMAPAPRVAPAAGPGFLDTISAWFGIRTLAPFAVGVACAAVGFALLGTPSPNDPVAGMSGTMGVPGIPAVEPLIAEPGLTAIATVERKASTVRLELALEADSPVEVTCDFDAAVLEPQGVQRFGAPMRALAVDNGRVRLDQSGESRVVLAWNAKEAAPTSLRLDFRSGERTWQRTVEIPAGS